MADAWVSLVCTGGARDLSEHCEISLGYYEGAQNHYEFVQGDHWIAQGGHCNPFQCGEVEAA